jgi:hypothetical protein
MKLSKTFLTGVLAFALVFGMILAGCDNGTGGGGGGGGGESGIGTLTISGFKNQFNDKTVTASDVKGTHTQLNSYTFQGGVKAAGGAIDGSETLTIKSNKLIVPVIGKKGGDEFAFSEGTYTLQALTIDNVTETLSATFDANGNGTASVANTQFAP